ncbi:hypothetical protein LCGC14_2035160 [marine sediment metagenome]|uniref:Band 7 domain-containing protein n=1 Tax=marine sediment metagenome TaxID=412755 RepID=A0A0F9FG36_9ZZZZ
MTNFLNRIFETLRKLTPRLELIQPDEMGIRVTLGTREKILSPGWYLFWGVFQEIFFTTVTTRVKDLRPQSVFTKEGRNLTVSGIIKYKVTDIQKVVSALYHAVNPYFSQNPGFSSVVSKI